MSETVTPTCLDSSEVATAERLLKHLAAATRNRLFYPSDHAIVRRSLGNLRETAAELLEDRLEVNIGLLGEEWIVQDTVLRKAFSLALDIKRRLKDRELTSITLLKGVTMDDLDALLNLLTADPEFIREKGASFLRSQGAHAVTVGRIAFAGEDAGPSGSTGEVSMPEELLQQGAVLVSQMYAEAFEGAMDFQKARVIVSDMMDLISSGSTALTTMLDIKSHDDYTFTHIVNVCVLTLAQARRMNFDEETLNEVGLAALMHDIGKQRIPSEIIRKPSRLTRDEFEMMKMHPIYGAEMLRVMPGTPDMATMVAFEHHLRYDCSGYPSVRHTRELHPCTYITTIADAFDAMRTLRPYSRQMSQQEVAVRMEADSGTHFEAVLLRRFFRMLDLFPCGSEVVLSTGEEAVVLRRRPQDYMKPVVRITTDAEGKPLDDGPEVDLANDECSEPITIAGAPDPKGNKPG